MFTLTRDTLGFLRWARRMDLDTVIDLELFSRFTALMTGLCGADRRVGFYRFHGEGLYRGEMLTHRVAYNAHIHIAKNFIALVDSLLAQSPTVPYAKTFIGDDQVNAKIRSASAEERARVLDRIRALTPFDPGKNRLVLINPNASELLPHRRWAASRYAELIGRILANFEDVVVLITGGPEERAGAERLAAANPAFDLVRRAFSIDRFACALCRGRAHGEQRLGSGPLFRGGRRADHRAVRPGNAKAVSAAWTVTRHLCRSRLLAVCQRAQSPADGLYRQRMHAGDYGRRSFCGGGRSSRHLTPSGADSARTS